MFYSWLPFCQYNVISFEQKKILFTENEILLFQTKHHFVKNNTCIFYPRPKYASIPYVPTYTPVSSKRTKI